MVPENNSRRGFLKGMAALLGGIGVFSLTAAPARAGRSHWRGGYGGYGGGFRRSGRRYYGGYGGGYGGGYYGGYAPRYYGGGGGYYGGGYAVPYVSPVVPVRPYYNGGFYGPIMKRDAPRAIDALSLLEA